MNSDTAQQQEPSMEEILASIRKIISEDGPAEGADANKDVVALTSPIPENAPEAHDPEPVDVGDLSETLAEPPPLPEEPMPEEPMPEMMEEAALEPPSPPPVPHFAPVPEPDPPEPDPVITSGNMLADSETASKAANAFGRLHGPASPVPATDPRATTLEDLVKQVLRPVLKDWIDANLAPMVEEHIQREMDRIRAIKD